ncbi:FAD-dependent monooxygenase [Sphingobium nicotianae]|uniref:FAD-dependent monooxygenase n=1 Tax=Sphingobium nicotianae TaxID=2782607 RepID=A0A9X1DBF0_9SPHN|nr:FAD-dependent monooxygenase [Sphingobium nicotianae]MBT2186847.1 FAD-dependent monooxygenase [Sphingobium nicotianae]
MDEQVPILIVGGSLVGLTMSALLGHHGVPNIVVERHRGTAIHPRAAAFHQRTMEIFRSIGLQEEVEEAAEREFVQNGAILSVDTLGGRELACFYRSVNEGVEQLSPTSRLFITQIGLEPILRRRAAELGADLRYGTELTSFTQDADGIVATVKARDDGAERIIRAKYLIAADGAHSAVRRALGIPMEGRGAFAQCATIYFKADVRALLRGRNLSVVYVNQPDLLAFFRFAITADAGFLAVFATFDDQGRRSTELEGELSPARYAAMVRDALGVPDEFPVEIDNVQRWTATAATASSFRDGHVFLAGDAAHLMPPTGGFGGNTGVADAHNLAWKLAMVLDGRAAVSLLDSYEAERRPVAALTVEQAYRRYVERVDSTLPATNLAANISDTAIELGSWYHSGAVCEGDAGDDLTENPENPSGAPGTRLPHVWLHRNGLRISTLDLVGRDFMLLAAPQAEAWIDAAKQVEAIDMHRITEPAVADMLGIASQGALLIRPDGVVAWRTDHPLPDPGATLKHALEQLGRDLRQGR